MRLFLQSYHFSLFVYLLSLSHGQGQDDAYWSCPLGETFKNGLDFLIDDDAIVPAVGILFIPLNPARNLIAVFLSGIVVTR